MKKFICIAIAIMSVFALIACNGNGTILENPETISEPTAPAQQPDKTDVPSLINAETTDDIIYLPSDDFKWSCKIEDKNIVNVSIAGKEPYTEIEEMPNLEKITVNFKAVSEGETNVTLIYGKEGEPVGELHYKVSVTSDNTITIENLDKTNRDTEAIQEIIDKNPEIGYYSLYAIYGEIGNDPEYTLEDLVKTGFTPGDIWLQANTDGYITICMDINDSSNSYKMKFDEKYFYNENDEPLFVYRTSEEGYDESVKMGTIILISNGSGKYYEFRRYTDVVDEFDNLMDDFDIAYLYLKARGYLPNNIYEDDSNLPDEWKQPVQPDDSENP